MPRVLRHRLRDTPAALRALVAGLLAAGVMALVVTVPSVGAGAVQPAGAARLDPSEQPTADDVSEPEPTPTEAPPTIEVTAEPTTAPPPDPETPGPPTEVPTQDPPTTEPTPPAGETEGPIVDPVPETTAPEQPGPVMPGQRPRLGAQVATGDIVLGRSYWSRANTDADLRVTVANTGSIVERISMRYTLPVGVTDAGTPGCKLAGGRTYVCGAWVAGTGLRWATTIKLRIAGTAWQRMPLSGSVDVTASAPGRTDLGTVTDNQGFAVLFPPGPPVAGISLAATEVAFAAETASAALTVALTNTGDAASTGAVEVLLPDGVTVQGQPSGCTAGDERTRCELGRVGAGQTVTVTLPLSATLAVQRLAPLSGAVFGSLLAPGGRLKQVQMSFRITAAAATATPSPSAASTSVGVATASQGVIGGFAPVAGSQRGMTGVQKTAVALVVVSVLLVVLALALATTSLRRRMEDDSTGAVDSTIAVD